MKKLTILTAIIVALFTACEPYEPRPDAQFSVSMIDGIVYADEVLSFSNQSSHATSYEWDFGDGSSSNVASPSHVFANSGTYVVTLVAYNGSKSDQVTMTITVQDLMPIPEFSVDYDLVIPGEQVVFYNTSAMATSYKWNFGDGTTSIEEHPSHAYTKEGEYEVSLAAKLNDYIEYAYLTIIVQKTTLEVTVVDYDNNDLIKNANVRLYDTYADWDAISNDYVIEAGTDSYGFIAFKGLDTKPYYLDIYNSNYTNEKLGLEDINFIKTDALQHAMINEFTAYVDYDPITKAYRVRELRPVLKSATALRTKAERMKTAIHTEKVAEPRRKNVKSHR